MITKLTATTLKGKTNTWDRKDANSPAYDFDNFMRITGSAIVNTKSVEVTVNDITEYEQICKLCDEKNRDMVVVIYDPT